jgi:hypothetical protein
MCPKSWQDQYNLTQDSLPQSIRKLLGVLENVEKVVANSNAKEKAVKENTDKATGKRKKGKCKGSSSTDYRIPKKVRVEKSCVLCQKHGGVHTTHNTSECRKYKKDGTLKKSFSKRQPLDQSAMAITRKKMPIPSHSSWNASRVGLRLMPYESHKAKLEKAVKKTQKSL